MRQVVIYKGQDGKWIAEVPSLPGCVSQGDTREDALRNVREAIDLWIEVMTERGEQVPPDSLDAEVCLV